MRAGAVGHLPFLKNTSLDYLAAVYALHQSLSLLHRYITEGLRRIPRNTAHAVHCVKG